MNKVCAGRVIVGIPVVLEVVVVPVPGLTVPVEVPDVEVTIGIAVTMPTAPSKTPPIDQRTCSCVLRVESNSGSRIP